MLRAILESQKIWRCHSHLQKDPCEKGQSRVSRKGTPYNYPNILYFFFLRLQKGPLITGMKSYRTLSSVAIFGAETCSYGIARMGLASCPGIQPKGNQELERRNIHVVF